MKKFMIIAALAALASCGTVYRSSSVVDGTDVSVVPVTAQSILTANDSPFDPKTLPQVFSLTAGTGSVGRGVGAGALPDTTFGRTSRPGSTQLRIPPAVDPGPYKIGIGDVVLLSTPSSGSTVEQLSGLLAAQNSRQGYTVKTTAPSISRMWVVLVWPA